MMFFEYCNLGTLNDLIKNGRIPDHILQYMLRQFFNGLSQLHLKEAGHNDIKPANLFVTYDKPLIPG